jgi:hypothetical protein
MPESTILDEILKWTGFFGGLMGTALGLINFIQARLKQHRERSGDKKDLR